MNVPPLNFYGTSYACFLGNRNIVFNSSGCHIQNVGQINTQEKQASQKSYSIHFKLHIYWPMPLK